MIWIIVLIIVLLLNKEPTSFTIVKEKYKKLQTYIKNNHETINPSFKILQHPVILTGYTRGKIVGYNTDKGSEIGLCIDGTPNQIFHILLHELAHSTVTEYSHSDDFWNNFNELKKLCTKIGIYTPIDNKVKVCGKFIQDQE